MKRLLSASTIIALVGCSSGAVTENPYAPYGGRNAALEELERLSPDERRQFLELSPEERQWALDHPEAARSLGQMSPEDRAEVRRQVESLPPEMQRQIRENPEAYLPK